MPAPGILHDSLTVTQTRFIVALPTRVAPARFAAVLAIELYATAPRAMNMVASLERAAVRKTIFCSVNVQPIKLPPLKGNKAP